MSSVPPPGSSSSGSSGSNWDLPPEVIPHGPLLPADNPFVKAVGQMYANIGQTLPTLELQQIATQLLNQIQQNFSNQINQETQESRQRRKEDLNTLLGND